VHLNSNDDNVLRRIIIVSYNLHMGFGSLKNAGITGDLEKLLRS
jgi:hypothetical protein